MTVNQMASITNKSAQTIYSLIRKGNSVRKMESRKIADRLLIPLSELTEFPFTGCGTASATHVYHYNNEGRIVEDE